MLLTYYTDKGRRTIPVEIIYFPACHWDTETYLIRLETGEAVASEEKLADAISLAQIALHQRDDFGIPLTR